MPSEPSKKRVVAFFDGQNLFHAAVEAFSCKYPNYDPKALATKIALDENWELNAYSRAKRPRIPRDGGQVIQR